MTISLLNQAPNIMTQEVVLRILVQLYKNESEENDIMVESCESCGEMFDDIEDLIDHYGTTGHLK